MAPKPPPKTPEKKEQFLDAINSSPIAPNRHKRTPKRTAIRTLVAETSEFKSRIFYKQGVTPRTGYRIINGPSDRTIEFTKDGRPQKLTKEKVQEIIDWFTGDYIARTTKWEDLVSEFELNCHWKTVKRALNKAGYHKCKACQRGYITPENVKKRYDFALDHLD
ncbi:hypothetical protein MMC24_003702 [Lignoscripta atroalba]|nr:hypothetical protein [Lignoscripta atroalba]